MTMTCYKQLRTNNVYNVYHYTNIKMKIEDIEQVLGHTISASGKWAIGQWA